ETKIEIKSRNSLSENDRRIMEIGEIGHSSYVWGGVVGTWPGLGIGHAIQGRYFSRGWIFTVGEIASAVLAVQGRDYSDDSCEPGNPDNCSESSISDLYMLGAVGVTAFRIWEIIDVWAAPPEHNRKYHQIKKRLNQGSGGGLSLFIIPKEKDYIVLNLKVRF
ncbi:MAG: hypothetical protein ACE5H1_11135, partial [Thermodesulfobacteriota bacterium]